MILPKREDLRTKLYFVEKTDRQEMEVEGRERRRPVNAIKPASSKPGPTRWYKTYVTKEMMAIEKIENTEAASKSPPKKGNPNVKTKSKGTPYEPQKKINKNTSKKTSGIKSVNEDNLNDGFLVKIHMFLVLKNYLIRM